MAKVRRRRRRRRRRRVGDSDGMTNL